MAARAWAYEAVRNLEAQGVKLNVNQRTGLAEVVDVLGVGVFQGDPPYKPTKLYLVLTSNSYATNQQKMAAALEQIKRLADGAQDSDAQDRLYAAADVFAEPIPRPSPPPPQFPPAPPRPPMSLWTQYWPVGLALVLAFVVMVLFATYS